MVTTYFQFHGEEYRFSTGETCQSWDLTSSSGKVTKVIRAQQLVRIPGFAVRGASHSSPCLFNFEFRTRAHMHPSVAIAHLSGDNLLVPSPAPPKLKELQQEAVIRLSQLLTFPNQLTLLRMMFLPFIVNYLVDGKYKWALILFVIAGFSDGLDGLLARTLDQKTLLGQYLDPIADKLLLSTTFLVLSILHKIPWKFTVLVFSRDISILAASAVLYAIAGLRDFRPSIFGKANTFAQLAAVFFVMLLQIYPIRWIAIARLTFLRAVFGFTIISAIHYVILVGRRLRAMPSAAK